MKALSTFNAEYEAFDDETQMRSGDVFEYNSTFK